MFEVDQHGRDSNGRTDDSQQGCRSERDGTQGCWTRPFVTYGEGYADIRIIVPHADKLSDAVFA